MYSPGWGGEQPLGEGLLLLFGAVGGGRDETEGRPPHLDVFLGVEGLGGPTPLQPQPWPLLLPHPYPF